MALSRSNIVVKQAGEWVYSCLVLGKEAYTGHTIYEANYGFFKKYDYVGTPYNDADVRTIYTRYSYLIESVPVKYVLGADGYELLSGLPFVQTVCRVDPFEIDEGPGMHVIVGYGDVIRGNTKAAVSKTAIRRMFPNINSYPELSD